jgi:hypothetical protein
MPVSPAAQEPEFRRISLRPAKSNKLESSFLKKEKKLYVVIRAYNPSHEDCISRRIKV